MKTKLMLASIELPPGYRISLYAEGVTDARSMVVSPSGVLFVGTRKEGAIHAVIDDDRDHRADRVITIAQGLDMPNGVALWDGDLYVAEVSRILRFADVEAHLDKPRQPEVVYDQYPKDRAHGWKFIRFGPDGRLYVPVGAPCNVCRPDQPVYASLTSMNRDGSGFEIYAHGIRNTVGFDWHPRTGVLWFTDNGRDWMGDDRPPDELNRAPMQGLHFGFPMCHGRDLPDPEFGSERSCSEFVAPAVELGPHVAALGMRFYTGAMFPGNGDQQLFIAEHGSWNRSEKIGYRVMRVTLAGDQVLSVAPFARGWLLGQTAWGRPVDVEVMPDGALLVSDDKNGVIYRIDYSPQTVPPSARPPYNPPS